MSKETRLKEVLAIVNNKGGVGKTTTVQSLAAALVRQHKEYRVLVVDLDPQGHLSLLHGWNDADHQNDRTIYDALRKGQSVPVYKTNRTGVYLSPGSPELQEVDSDLFKQVINPAGYNQPDLSDNQDSAESQLLRFGASQAPRQCIPSSCPC